MEVNYVQTQKLRKQNFLQIENNEIHMTYPHFLSRCIIIFQYEHDSGM